MENTYSWTCENEIGTTIPQYANSQGITYEAARRQVVKYLDNELQGHIRVRNKTKYLDDFAIEFLNEHRRPQAQWSNPDMTEYIKSLLHCATAEPSDKSSDIPLHFIPFKEFTAKSQASQEAPQGTSEAPQTQPLNASSNHKILTLQAENELLKKQLTDMQAAYNKLLVETSNLNAKIYYAEKNAENAEKNSKRWYNLALECIRTFNQQQSQDFNAAASDTTDRNPSED